MAKDNTPVLQTRPFKIELGTINGVAFGQLVARWWWAMAIPLLIFFIVGVYADTRWLFLIPILACLVYPFLGMMAFIAQTSTPRLAQLIRPHYVVITETCIEVIPVSDEINYDTRTPYIISAEDVKDITVSGKHIVVLLRSHSFMLIPLEAVDDKTVFIDAVYRMTSS